MAKKEPTITYNPDGRKTDRLNVVVQPDRKQWWMEAAKSAGVEFSDWVRSVLDAAAKEQGE